MASFTILQWFVLVIAWFAVVIGVKYLSILKGIIQSNKTLRQELRPGPPLGLPGLDVEKLLAATQQMEQLGFVHLEDHLTRFYQADSALEPKIAAPIADPNATPGALPPRFTPHGFGRVMVHPEHGCIGKIIFVSTSDSKGKRPVKSWTLVVINSLTGLEDDDWVYSTNNHAFNKFMNALMKLQRQPRRLATRVPGSAPQELLAMHLARRAEIAKVAGIAWEPRPTLEQHYRLEERSVSDSANVYGRLTPIGMAWQLFWLKREKDDGEWLGELKGRLPSAR